MSSTISSKTWTTPYYGVQHFGCERGKSNSSHWLTVEDHGACATLFRWFPGCGFRPLRSRHDDAETARQAGEAWLREVAA
jgi:hypothetical protein